MISYSIVNNKLKEVMIVLMVNTHKRIATDIYHSLRENKSYINKNRFIWGNIKPDGASKYKLYKHYFKESFPIILKKINYLQALNEEDFNNEISKEKFSSELGVVCHFLCDYFCIPHYERWEFKDNMKEHVLYEKRLGRVSKFYTPIFSAYPKVEDFEEFILLLQDEYSKEKDYVRDLDFAYFVCNTIVNNVINSIKANSENQIEQVS